MCIFEKQEGYGIYSIGLCLVLILDLAYWNLKDRFNKDLTLTFLDVGHGDSILVEFPKGKRMLIDGGGSYEDRFDIGKNVVAPFLWNKKIREIRLSRSHPSRSGSPEGLKLHRRSILESASSGARALRAGSESYLQLEEILSKKKIQRFILNEKVPPLVIEGVKVTFLNPPGSGGITEDEPESNVGQQLLPRPEASV